MSVGKQLLFSVLTTEPVGNRGDLLTRLAEAGVVSEMFPNEDEQRAFSFMSDYRIRYGVCPSLALVEVETDIRFPQYISQDPFDFWFDEFRNYSKHTIMIDLLQELEEHLVDGRVSSAIELLGEKHIKLKNLMRERKTTTSLSEIACEALQRHQLLQASMLHDGVFTGFPYIDEVTGGVQPGDVWIVAGESASGKTYVLCRCAMSSVASGKNALFLSMEMPNLQVGRRSLAMGSSVSANGFRVGHLSAFAVTQVQNFLTEWNADHDNKLKFVEGRVNYSVNDLRAKIMEIGPDIVFIDGAYMIKTSKRFGARWEMQMEVIETIKQIAMEENIAIVASFQFDQKQKTKGLSTIMGGQAIGQIASVVIGIENEVGQSPYDGITYKELTLWKGREGERGKIRLRYDMNRTLIEQESVIDGEIETNTDSNDDFVDFLL